MGCGESKHAVATENNISKSKSKNSNSNIIAEISVEEKEKLIKEPGVDVNVEVREEGKEKENAKVIDNGNGESGKEKNVKGRENSEDGKENAKVEEEIQGGNAMVTDNGNGISDQEENVKENEEKFEAPVVIVEENKEGKSDEISVHQVQEPEEEKLKIEKESIIPKENASEGKIDLNDDVEGKEINQEAKKDSKTEEVIKVEEEKEVKEEVVLPKDSATKGE